MDIDPEVAPGLEPAPQDRVKDLKRQTDEVIDTLEQNMKRLVKREENLEGLEYISMELEEETKVFKQTAKKVKRSYWWKSVKLVVVVVVVVLVVVLVIILVIVLFAKGVIPKP
ncbi:vesicle-associated membrane protein 8-like [Gadus chalcogrammus]|uniref:vesicle-associated membrane protein 8-like n=1 Tax=Gadus chalcogrammus TaxID=1042646 RepID=UPI0024C4886A|nr:vesicle-associated membrane protein 8-like [Gadus chalcogrammus]